VNKLNAEQNPIHRVNKTHGITDLYILYNVFMMIVYHKSFFQSSYDIFNCLMVSFRALINHQHP
jgi:hypothetical protein